MEDEASKAGDSEKQVKDLETKITDMEKDLKELKITKDDSDTKNEELEQFNKLFVDREFRIKELRDRVKELEKKNGNSR